MNWILHSVPHTDASPTVWTKEASVRRPSTRAFAAELSEENPPKRQTGMSRASAPHLPLGAARASPKRQPSNTPVGAMARTVGVLEDFGVVGQNLPSFRHQRFARGSGPTPKGHNKAKLRAQKHS
jgi:hypothetical protein